MWIRPLPLPRLLLAVALRAGGLIAASAVYTHLAPTLLPDDDDGLGTGLLWFAMLVSVCSGIGVVDALRWPFVRVAVVWVTTGALVAVAATLMLGPGASDPAAVLADLRESGPFVAELVAVPALFFGGLVALLVAGLDRRPRTAR